MISASNSSRPTTDQHQIRLWAASQHAMPAEILPGLVDAEPAQLHFFIPGDSSHEPRLRMLGWEDFFAMFAAQGLTFVHEILSDGRPGRHFELLQVEDATPGMKPRQAPVHDSDTASEYAE